MDYKADEKINAVRAVARRDKARRAEAAKTKRVQLLPFCRFLEQKQLLGEASFIDDIADTMLATLPINASPADVQEIAAAIGIMSQVGEVVVMSVAIMPDH
jgi:hypothetical protein